MAVLARVIQGQDKRKNSRVFADEGRRVVYLKGGDGSTLPLGQTIYFDHVVMGNNAYFAQHSGWWKPEQMPSVPLHSKNAFGVLYPATLGSESQVSLTVRELRNHNDYSLVSVVAGFNNKEQAETAMKSGVYGALLITDPFICGGIEAFELDSRVRELSKRFPHDLRKSAHYILCAADKGISSVVLHYAPDAFNQLKELMEKRQLPGRLTTITPCYDADVAPELMRIIKERAEGKKTRPTVWSSRPSSPLDDDSIGSEDMTTWMYGP